MTQKLTRHRLGQIYEMMISNFTDHLGPEALLTAINSLTIALSSQPESESMRRSFMPVWLEVIIMFLVFGLVALLVVMGFKYGQKISSICFPKKPGVGEANGGESESKLEEEGEEDDDDSSSLDSRLDIRENWNMTMSLKRKLSHDRRKMSRMLSYV